MQQIVKSTPNWRLYRIFEDQDSGKDMFRPGFQSMMCDAFDRLFDIILVKSMSRFSRNAIEALEKVQELRRLGIELISEEENISTQENEQDLELALRTAIAQAESESLSAAIKWGLKQTFKKGDSKLYRRKCFGYDHNEYGELIVNTAEAVVVRSVFDSYLKGYSVDRIMRDLASHHIKSPTGKQKWSKRTIQTMLSNEKYIGNVLLGKTYTGTFPNHKQKINHGEHDQFLLNDAHSPIIAKEVFEEVQEELKRRSNIEKVDGKVKRKNTHYSAKNMESWDE